MRAVDCGTGSGRMKRDNMERLSLVFNGGPQQGEVHLGVQNRQTEHLGLATRLGQC